MVDCRCMSRVVVVPRQGRPLRHFTIAQAKAVLPSAWELLTDDDDEDYEEDSKVESAENCDSELAIPSLPALSIVTQVETIAIDVQVIADRQDDDDDLQEMPLLLVDDENKVLQDDSLMNNAVVDSSENHLEFFLLEEEPAEANNFASKQVAAFAIQDVVSAETTVTNTNLVESKIAAAVPDGVDDSTSLILVIEKTVSITEKDKVADEAIHWDQHLNVCSDHFKTVCVSVLGQSPTALNDDNKKSITVAEPLVQVLNKSRTPYFFDDEPASCTLYDDSELVKANEQA